MKITRFCVFNGIALAAVCLLALPGVSRAALTVTATPASALGKVMPLGDSITRGNDVAGGYRAPLYTLMTNWLDTFTFVGSQTDNSTQALIDAGQTHHEGHGGYTITNISGRAGIDENLVTWIGPSGAAPDRILLMIGSNDIYLGSDMTNAPTRLSSLIDHIYGFRPNVILYVASISPQVGHQSDVLAYNATIPGIVASHRALGRNVFYVPMYEAMNINTDLDQWGLHPNALGYQKMAQVWNEALNTITTGTVTTTTLDSSVNPSVYGQQVVFTATVKTNADTATGATGNVVFSVDGVAKSVVALSGGAAAWTNSALPTEAHLIRAVYVGDGVYAASSVNFTQTNNAGAASKLAFGQQPTTTRPGYAISPAVTVLVQDADGNTVTSDSSTDVTISGTTFSNSTLTVKAVSGVATFSNLKPTTVANGITLTASGGSLAGATSSPFNVGVVVISGSFIPPKSTTTTVGEWDSYVIGTGQSFMVGRWDTAGAILNQAGGVITITGTWGNYSIGNSPGGWGIYNMSGTAVFNATNLSGSDSGSGIYHIMGFGGSKLTMTNNAVANIASLSLEANAGTPAKVVLSGSASLTVGSNGLTIGAGSYVDFVSGSLATLTITGSHDFTAMVNAGTIRIDGATALISQFQVTGNTISLKPVFTGLDHFDITINSALPLTAGTPASFTIIAKDGSEAILMAYTNTVDFAGTAGFTGTSVAFTAGVLSDVSLAPVTAGTNKTLEVVGGGKIGTSSTFTVNPGVASKLGFGQQPTVTMPGAVISPAVTVLVQDANGNTVTGDNSTDVTIGGTTFTSSTLTVTASNGVATFSNLRPTTAGSSITLTANSNPSYTPATSSSFTVGPITVYGSFTPSGTSTIGYSTNYTINANGGNFYVDAGAVLNQTGRVITVAVGWGHFGVGLYSGPGVYNMSGDASLIATSLTGGDSGNGTFFIGAGSRLTMTNSAVANIKYLCLRAASGASVAKIVLSGSASLTVYGFTDASGGTGLGTGSYIDFVSGSLATLTITGGHDFQALVAAGSIRIDGAVASWSQFKVSGNTLSLIVLPAISNGPGATDITESSATMNALLASTGSGTATVFFCYGTSDAGTGDWANVVSKGNMTGAGSFSNAVLHLYSGTTYYYRARATNEYGLSWAPASTNFTTLRASGMMLLIQ